MSVTVWTLPAGAVSVPVPVVYSEGVSTAIEGGCLTVSSVDRVLSTWGSGAWQRADIS